MSRIQANTNFHKASEKSVFDARRENAFLEYRRRWYEYPANFIVGNFPIHLDIESTNVCNLRCPFCATTFSSWGPARPGFMDLRLLKRIIDEGADNGLCSIKLSFRGEPLLHPEIVEIVRYARKKGIMDIYFNTNAVFLDGEMAERLIDAGLFRISISIEGTSKAVYERYRVGARFEDVLKNIENLKKIRKERKVSHPQIRVQTVLLDELKDSFSAYLRFWQEIADEVSYLDARKETPGSEYSVQPADWACPFLWQRMVILWDGTMLPCLAHRVTEEHLDYLGNVQELSIREAWKSGTIANYRKLHRSGESHRLQSCRFCSYRAMEVEKQKLL